jgi:hypothetical protein
MRETAPSVPQFGLFLLQNPALVLPGRMRVRGLGSALLRLEVLSGPADPNRLSC